MIDGCGRFGALRWVLFPLLRPAVVAAGTFAFVLSWGEFLLALALISKTEVKTLPLALQAVFDPYSFSWGEVMAGGVVIAAPAIILFFMFRSQLVGGLHRRRRQGVGHGRQRPRALLHRAPRPPHRGGAAARPRAGRGRDRGAGLRGQRRHRAQRLSAGSRRSGASTWTRIPGCSSTAAPTGPGRRATATPASAGSPRRAPRSRAAAGDLVFGYVPHGTRERRAGPRRGPARRICRPDARRLLRQPQHRLQRCARCPPGARLRRRRHRASASSASSSCGS